MSSWMMTLARDWDQPAEPLPITELSFEEYDEPDDDGFIGALVMHEQVVAGHYRLHRFKMRKDQFLFFVEQIANRYAAGGPK